MEGYMADYNAFEAARCAKEFERSIDAMQILSPAEVAAAPATLYLNANLVYFWVHVTKQPAEVTHHIRKHTGSAMPAQFNNIAIYYTSQKQWALKFSTC